MKKLLFLLLTLPLFVASCSSSSNSDDVEPKIKTFKVEGKATSHNKISLDWEKVSGAYSYQVFYKAEGASKWETSNSIMPTIDNGTTMHWNGDFASFTPDTKYTIQVKAFRDSQEGSIMAESNVLEIKTLTEDAIFEIEGKAIAMNGISLSWDKIDLVYGYVVFYKADGTNEWNVLDIFDAKEDDDTRVYWSLISDELLPDTEYSIQVKAYRDSGSNQLGAESNVIEIRTLPEVDALLAGTWEQASISVMAETNDAELTAFIENEYMRDYKGKSRYQFLDNKTFVYEHTENLGMWTDKYLGQYSISNDIMTFTYTDKNGVVVNDIEAIKFAVNSSNFYVVRDLATEEYETIFRRFSGSRPVEELIINKVSFAYVYSRVK